MEAADLSSRGLTRLLRRWPKGTKPDLRHLVTLFTLPAEMGLLHILLPAIGEPETVKGKIA